MTEIEFLEATKNLTQAEYHDFVTEMPKPEEPQHDPVNHPSHYTDGGIETIDYIVAKNMDFFLGQVCKYISRAGKKDPAKELEDLRKAQFYLNRKIEMMERANNDA